MNDDELTLMMLQLIRVNGYIEHLETANLSYVDILNMVDSLIEKGFVQKNDSTLKITAKGERYFNSQSKKLKRRGLYKYFMPYYNARICQLQIDDIYIPSKTTIKKIGRKEK